MTTLHTAMPDLLGRHDTQLGAWQVNGVTHGPGQAWTAIGERRMQVPHGDTEIERSVRAHEMMHAKISPKPEDMKRWHARGKASPEALTSAEEARVNYLIGKLGFDVEDITDGSETQSGEFVAEQNRWKDAVMATVGFAGTGRVKKFLVGVRRHNPEWAKTLRAVNDKVVKELKKIDDSKLADTSDWRGLTPSGFRYTEAIAQMIDIIADPPKDDTEEASKTAPEGSEKHDDPQDTTGGAGESQDAPEGDKDGKDSEKPEPPITPDAIKGMEPDATAMEWDDLRVDTPIRPRRSAGGIGRKRIASATGKNPRRVNRMLTDPHHRVFDAKKAGKGGVVLIDASGSMSLTAEQINQITEAAPGCTVAMYASSQQWATDGKPNLWVLADKGTMVAEIPQRPKGNGVDAPAIRWAISRRQRKDSPVVWITDGLCHGPLQRYTHNAGVECVKTVLDANVIVRPDVDSAVALLNEMAVGRRPKKWYPVMWRKSWEKVHNRTIRSEVEFRQHDRHVAV